MSEQARLRNYEIAVLKRFYNVTSNRALIAAMLHHIDKLQDAKRDSLETAIRRVRA